MVSILPVHCRFARLKRHSPETIPGRVLGRRHMTRARTSSWRCYSNQIGGSSSNEAGVPRGWREEQVGGGELPPSSVEMAEDRQQPGPSARAE